MNDDIDGIKVYLQGCIELWVDHDLLRFHFSERSIWNALNRGYIRPMREFHCYSIETDRLQEGGA